MSGQRYFECLLLDLDGTLIDSRRLIISSVKFAARRAGKRVPPAQDIMKQYNVTTSPMKILRRFRIYDTESYWDHYSSNIKKLGLFGGRIRKKLNRISKAGVELGLITSLPRDIVSAILKHFGLSKFFTVVKTYERRAPKWKLIDSATRELNVDPFRTMYLGDMPGDVKAAKRANKGWGIWSGVAHWSRKRPEEFSDVEPDFVFRKFDEVVELVTNRIQPEDDCFEPSKECYAPHEQYLAENLKINRQSCRYCFFPSDCLNCSRFNIVVKLTPIKSELARLSRQVGVTVSACEWYYPRNYPRRMIDDDDSIDTRNLVGVFKKGNGEHRFRFRIALSMFYHLKKLQQRVPQYKNIDLIVPVPSNKKKIRERGYNPPEEAGKVLSHIAEIPIATNCLKTTAKRSRRTTRYYYEFEADKRRLMKNIHLRNMAKLAGKKILLLDDILTDGVTLSAYAQKIRDVVRPKPKIVALTFGLTKKERES